MKVTDQNYRCRKGCPKRRLHQIANKWPHSPPQKMFTLPKPV